MHAYHEGLPRYDASQILHDGCAECEERGANVCLALDSLDRRNFARAWQRAHDWNKTDDAGLRASLSNAEMPLLRVMWSMQVRLEGYGVRLSNIGRELAAS